MQDQQSREIVSRAIALANDCRWFGCYRSIVEISAMHAAAPPAKLKYMNEVCVSVAIERPHP